MNYDNWKLETPPSCSEKEREVLFCSNPECKDEILEGKEVYVSGVCYCGYCVEHVLKITK